jgi:8-oxo-dGTP pyrophosphatase MutT (NUDIX family)
VLLIERSVREEDPASGQVALPGGHVDPADPDLVATALREMEEEVGLTAADLAGPLRYVTTTRAARFSLEVAVFVGELGRSGRAELRPSPREVREVFWLPRSALGRPSWVDREGPRGRLRVEATVHAGHVVWGFTYRVLRYALLGVAFDAPAPPPR